MAIRVTGLLLALPLLTGCPGAVPGVVTDLETVFLPVTPAPPVVNRLIVNTSADQTLAIGTSINLAGVVTGGVPPYTFFWQIVSGPDQRLANDLSPVLTVSGLNFGKTEFRLTVTDFAGAVAVGDVNVTVVPVPLPAAGQAVPRLRS